MRLIGWPGVFVFLAIEMGKKPQQEELKFQLLGWILFIVCAVLFLASSIQNQDTIAIFASIVFLIACFVFLYPLIKTLFKKSKR